MIRKLDKLILKAFIGPFVATFFIACFVLMMQILWKYVDDLVGKGLDFLTIGEFLWYASASLLALAMPIAILISSIMTFGNLGETFELVAIKSAGISLLRFMRPLIFVAMLLSFVTFLFGNYVIPYANLKFVTLYSDIFYKKPAFDLREGVFFTHIPNYAIKVGKKDADGKTIRDVLIYEQSNRLQDNTIVAEKGEMKISDDQNYLEFNLYDGYRYQERGMPGDSTTEYTRLKFKEFKKLFDLTILQKQNSSDSAFRNSQKMLSARQLQVNIDSLRKTQDSLKVDQLKLLEKVWHYPRLPDTVYSQYLKGAEPLSQYILADSIKTGIWQLSYNRVAEIKNILKFRQTAQEDIVQELRTNKTEWHRKFSMSLACLILFFIGAPLGSIIRKGGLGMPLVAAIIFFLIFHLLNMFGEKFVRENITTPFAGMWLAIMVLIPIGAFLTYKAVHDSQLFNKEYYHRTFTRIKKLLRKKTEKSNLQT